MKNADKIDIRLEISQGQKPLYAPLVKFALCSVIQMHRQLLVKQPFVSCVH